MAAEPVDIQGRLGVLLDSVEDEFLKAAIAELFTMEKLKYGTANIACKSCGAEHRYRAEIASPDYKGIAYSLKLLLDATGRTKEPPKEEGLSAAALQQVREAVREVLQAEGEPVPY